MNKKLHIAICGNIGSGKTTLAKMLSNHFKWNLEIESVDDNPYLKEFYSDMKRWAFHLQIYFLTSRVNQLNRISNYSVTTIQDRTIYEDAYIFASNLKESRIIDKRDYECYLSLFNTMKRYVQKPDLLIYLRANIPKLVQQIEKRGRIYEQKIQIDYLKNLNEHYKNWIDNYRENKLLIIDMDNIDFIKNREDFSNIVNKVDLELNGLFTDFE